LTTRLITRIGLPADDKRAPGAPDLTAFREPTVGALVRTKGSLFALAQVSGSEPTLREAARHALDEVERGYYYDQTAGALGSLVRALKAANRQLYHRRTRLGIPERAGISLIALVVRGRGAHVVRLGPAAAVIVRGGRMYELPPPPVASEQDPRLPPRRVAATLGEALEVEPYRWEGQLAHDDRIALLSRNLANTVGVEELKRALATMRPALAVEHLHQLFAVRGGTGSDGLLALEIAELPITAAIRRPQPVRPTEPLAGLPDQSPVRLADAVGALFGRAGRARDDLSSAMGRALLGLLDLLFGLLPRSRPVAQRVEWTSLREEGNRRRRGLIGVAAVAAFMALGANVASLPGAEPTDAIPRAKIAREAVTAAAQAIASVEERVDGQNLLVRDPRLAADLLNVAHRELARAAATGIAEAELEPLGERVARAYDTLYGVTRLTEITTILDLAGAFEDLDPSRMVAADDGSLWLLEVGRGRVVRIDPGGEWTVVLHAGQAPETGGGRTAAAPWLIATAANDVVVIDRQRQAWRFDLDDRLPRPMALDSVETIDPEVDLLAAVQHRPPLEIFTLYLVERDGRISKWTPPAVLPVDFPNPHVPYLTEEADLSPADARDLIADANLWLLHRDTVTRVNFGRPVAQTDYRLDPPPDADARQPLDYRLVDGATIGDRELLYVYDDANARIIAFQRADGAFVRQWLGPRRGAEAELLDQVRSLIVGSVADGPPAAYLLTPDRVVRVVLD
jgi:hypothetical protein